METINLTKKQTEAFLEAIDGVHASDLKFSYYENDGKISISCDNRISEPGLIKTLFLVTFKLKNGK